MSSVYVRGNKLWCRLKGAKMPGVWFDQSTGFRVGQESEAERFATEAQKRIDARNRADGAACGPLTVAAYAERWIPVRKSIGVRSWDMEDGQLKRHVLPHLGHLVLAEVRAIHIRDWVRVLRAPGKLAPRTVRTIYGLVNCLFESAISDELIEHSPCRLKRGRELPAKRDADPEWRAQATYTVNEVEQLFSDPRLPVERRVQYAIKALAGLRHQEMAALRWRHYDPSLEPLGALTIARAYDSRACEEKDTKTGVTRRVPVHPVLAKILEAWKISHWTRIYGRDSVADDLIVPTRTLRSINVSDAGHALTEDLELLELRVKAGARRQRGSHDLRAWFITTCQTHGAPPRPAQGRHPRSREQRPGRLHARAVGRPMHPGRVP